MRLILQALIRDRIASDARFKEQREVSSDRGDFARRHSFRRSGAEREAWVRDLHDRLVYRLPEYIDIYALCNKVSNAFRLSNAEELSNAAEWLIMAALNWSQMLSSANIASNVCKEYIDMMASYVLAQNRNLRERPELAAWSNRFLSKLIKAYVQQIEVDPDLLKAFFWSNNLLTSLGCLTTNQADEHQAYSFANVVSQYRRHWFGQFLQKNLHNEIARYWSDQTSELVKQSLVEGAKPEQATEEADFRNHLLMEYFSTQPGLYLYTYDAYSWVSEAWKNRVLLVQRGQAKEVADNVIGFILGQKLQWLEQLKQANVPKQDRSKWLSHETDSIYKLAVEGHDVRAAGTKASEAVQRKTSWLSAYKSAGLDDSVACEWVVHHARILEQILVNGVREDLALVVVNNSVTREMGWYIRLIKSGFAKHDSITLIREESKSLEAALLGGKDNDDAIAAADLLIAKIVEWYSLIMQAQTGHYQAEKCIEHEKERIAFLRERGKSLADILTTSDKVIARKARWLSLFPSQDSFDHAIYSLVVAEDQNLLRLVKLGSTEEEAEKIIEHKVNLKAKLYASMQVRGKRSALEFVANEFNHIERLQQKGLKSAEAAVRMERMLARNERMSRLLKSAI